LELFDIQRILELLLDTCILIIQKPLYKLQFGIY